MSHVSYSEGSFVCGALVYLLPLWERFSLVKNALRWVRTIRICVLSQRLLKKCCQQWQDWYEQVGAATISLPKLSRFNCLWCYSHRNKETQNTHRKKNFSRLPLTHLTQQTSRKQKDFWLNRICKVCVCMCGHAWLLRNLYDLSSRMWVCLCVFVCVFLSCACDRIECVCLCVCVCL